MATQDVFADIEVRCLVPHGLKEVLKPHIDGKGERAIQHCRTPQIHHQRTERRVRRVYFEDGQKGRAD